MIIWPTLVVAVVMAGGFSDLLLLRKTPQSLVAEFGSVAPLTLGHAGDRIYNAAPRLTLSSRILHASGTAAALVDEWLRQLDSSAAAAVASRADFLRIAIALHSLTFSGNDPGLGKGAPGGDQVPLFITCDAQKAI